MQEADKGTSASGMLLKVKYGKFKDSMFLTELKAILAGVGNPG